MKNKTNKLEDQLNKFSKKYHESGLSEDQYFYHYTTSQGVLGIINSSKMHATNMRFMNDPEEIKYGLNLWIKHINDKFKHINKNYNKLLSDISKYYTKIMQDEVDGRRGIEYYVVSFSTHGDHLGQWRGYGNYGKGYSIKFKSSQFKHQNSNFPWKIEKIEYDSKKIEEEICKILDGYIDIVINNYDLFCVNPKENLIEITTKLIQISIIKSLKYKHIGYKDESEYRIIGMNYNLPNITPNLEFKTRDNFIIDYIEFEIEWSEDIEIIVGPALFNQNKSLLEDINYSLDAFAKQNDYKLNVIGSKIPFR